MVKTGPWVHLTEAQTMTFVATHTSVPVPHVYCAFLHRNRAYIVMERIRGQEIPTAWKQLSTEPRDRIVLQLGDMVRQLRKLPPPSKAGIQSCIGGSLHDPHIPRTLPRFGPFPTTQSFHSWLREGTEASSLQNISGNDDKQHAEEIQEIEAMIVKQDGPWPAPVFTHGDLNPFNILVRGKDIVGLVDWECSGWYPHYWEYTSAWYGNCTRTEWRDRLTSVLDLFPEELKMETVRQTWWGEV